MKYYALDPEVAGGFGENCRLDNDTHPPRILHFHHEFYGWLGDEILETVSHYLVSQRLWDSIAAANFTGVNSEYAELSFSDEFQELCADVEVPNFIWLKISGTPGTSDFGMSSDHQLVVSHPALKVLQQHHFRHCDVEPFSTDG